MRIRYSFLSALFLLGSLPAWAQNTLTKLGSVTLPGYGTELVVDGTTAYVLTASAGKQGLQVYDVSMPAAPRLLSTIALPGAGPISAVPPRHAVVSDGILFVSSYPSPVSFPPSIVMWSIDVSNPASPSVRAVNSTSWSNDLLVAGRGNYLYAVPDNLNKLYVYNRTPVVYSGGTPYLPQERQVDLPYSLSGVSGVSISDTTAYVQYTNSVFATLDLTDAAQPVSSPGTAPGTISATSGKLAAGLAQPGYAGSVPANTLRFYALDTPSKPTLLRSQAGSYGTRVAVGGQSVFTCGAISPFVSAVPSSSEPLRGYFLASNGATLLEAVADGTQGANALVAANNKAYVLTDTELSIYTFPSVVTATRGAATLAPLALYPNPASGTVRITQPAADGNVAIYDATGKLCLQTKLPASGTLDISTLPTGLYQVRTGHATGKLAIN